MRHSIKHRVEVFAALVRSYQVRPGALGFAKAVFFSLAAVLGLTRSCVRYRPYIPEPEMEWDPVAKRPRVRRPRRPVTEDELIAGHRTVENVCRAIESEGAA
jgi:hypothetical protein